MAMPMGENIRAKAEEIRTKVRSRIEEMRGGGSSPEHSPILGRLGIMKGPLVTEIREKGAIATARERVTKFRGGGGLLGEAGAPETPATTVAPPTPRVTMYPATAELPIRVDLMTKSRLY